MKLSAVRQFAMSLPEVTEQPHFDFGSFRVRGKIFVTMPPGDRLVHVFVPESMREEGPAMYPEFLERLSWGEKVVGVRITLAEARPAVVKRHIRAAWEAKAPKSLLSQREAPLQRKLRP
jgi:hypothetical protein